MVMAGTPIPTTASALKEMNLSTRVSCDLIPGYPGFYERGSVVPEYKTCPALTRKMHYDQRTNRYMALGRQIFQDACAGQTCLRTRQDRVERPTGEASTRGPCWRPAASDNGGRRVSGSG